MECIGRAPVPVGHRVSRRATPDWAGVHLPIVLQLNTLPDNVIAKGAADPDCASGNLGSCFLTTQVTNPFYGKISQGVLQNPTVTQNQLLLPFPEYGGLGNSGSDAVSAITKRSS